MLTGSRNNGASVLRAFKQTYIRIVVLRHRPETSRQASELFASGHRGLTIRTQAHTDLQARRDVPFVAFGT